MLMPVLGRSGESAASKGRKLFQTGCNLFRRLRRRGRMSLLLLSLALRAAEWERKGKERIG
jgi:hypothetical protein